MLRGLVAATLAKIRGSHPRKLVPGPRRRGSLDPKKRPSEKGFFWNMGLSKGVHFLEIFWTFFEDLKCSFLSDLFTNDSFGIGGEFWGTPKQPRK